MSKVSMKFVQFKHILDALRVASWALNISVPWALNTFALNVLSVSTALLLLGPDVKTGTVNLQGHR